MSCQFLGIMYNITKTVTIKNNLRRGEISCVSMSFVNLIIQKVVLEL